MSHMRLGRFIFAKALACESKSHIAHKVSCFGSYDFLKRVNRLACSSPALKFSGFQMTQAVAEIIVCRHK